MSYVGINFMAGLSDKTPGAGEVVCIGDAWPTTRSDETFGFNTNKTGDSRTRNTSLDRRLVGGINCPNAGATSDFRLRLKDGPGLYSVRVALGDPDNPQNHRCRIRDGVGGAQRAEIIGSTGSADISWLDATGVERIGETAPPEIVLRWVSENEAIEVEITDNDPGNDPIIEFQFGAHSSGTVSTFPAHVSVDFVAGGGSGATASGVTLTASAALIPGTASGSSAGTANGVTLTATAALLYAGGTLQFQAAGMEFGARTGLGIDTFALDASVNYRYTVHADGLVLGAALVTSDVVATDSSGKLPNLVNSLIAPGTLYRVHAIRQSDGEAATFRMRAFA